MLQTSLDNCGRIADITDFGFMKDMLSAVEYGFRVHVDEALPF
jgi:hypothetical protein